MCINARHSCIVYRVLKDLQEWKEAPLDCVELSLYQLQGNEIKHGLAGLGEYTVAPEYVSLGTEGFSIDYLPTNCPKVIVRGIKDGKPQQLQSVQMEGSL